MVKALKCIAYSWQTKLNKILSRISIVLMQQQKTAIVNISQDLLVPFVALLEGKLDIVVFYGAVPKLYRLKIGVFASFLKCLCVISKIHFFRFKMSLNK